MKISGVKIQEPKSASEIFNQVEEYRRVHSVFIQLFNHEMVIGREHLLWAYDKAEYLMGVGKNRSGSLEMETLLIASGEWQIKEAIRKMGLKDDAHHTVVMVDDLMDDFLDDMGWIRDDSVLSPSLDKLMAFGITEEEINTTKKPYDLVFEIMATSFV